MRLLFCTSEPGTSKNTEGKPEVGLFATIMTNPLLIEAGGDLSFVINHLPFVMKNEERPHLRRMQ